MKPKPPHLGPRYGEQFCDRSVALAYQNRPPYPDDVFEVLRALSDEEHPVVLDLGCGTGEVALGIADWASRVDALDISNAMCIRPVIPSGTRVRQAA